MERILQGIEDRDILQQELEGCCRDYKHDFWLVFSCLHSFYQRYHSKLAIPRLPVLRNHTNCTESQFLQGH